MHDEIHPFRAKSEFFHNSLKEAPFDPVKSFAHIKLGCHETLLPSRFVIKEVHKFKCHQHIVYDKAIRSKRTLIL